MAQDQQTRISAKTLPYRQPSPHDRPDSGHRRYLHPDPRRSQPQNANVLMDDIDLNYVSTPPAGQQSAGNDNRGRAPSRGASPGRTPQQKPVGLEGTSRPAARNDSRPTSPGPGDLPAGGAPPPTGRPSQPDPSRPPRACWSCGATTHLKVNCNASAAAKEIYRQARLTQIELVEVNWQEMMEERASLMDTSEDPCHGRANTEASGLEDGTADTRK